MNSVYDYLGILAGILALCSFGFYYYAIFVGKATPNRVTWFVLTLVGAMIASSYYSLGARETIWVAIGYVAGPLFTFFLSLKYGEGGYTILDQVCIALAFLGIIFWSITGSAFWTLLLSIFTDFIGIIPTIVKSYYRPDSEYLPAWLITFIVSILNILAIKDWEFTIYIYPIYMITFNGIILFLLCVPSFRNRIKLLLT